MKNAEILDPTRREVDEALKSIQHAEDPFFASLEADFMSFLRDSKDPDFIREYREEVRLKTEEPRAELHDNIKDWENENSKYQIKNIEEEVELTDYSDKEVTEEFVDYLIGNARSVLEEQGIFDKMVKIKVIRITKDNNGIIMSVESSDQQGMNLFFFGAPEFGLKRAELIKSVFP